VKAGMNTFKEPWKSIDFDSKAQRTKDGMGKKLDDALLPLILNLAKNDIPLQ
jgi:hypothetical protein